MTGPALPHSTRGSVPPWPRTEYDTAFSALAETETAVATDYRSLVARTANLVPFQKVLDELKKQTAPTEPAAGPAKGR